MAVEFDLEWEIVLDRVKKSKDLSDIYSLMNKWQHNAKMEMCDPGSYYRLLAQAEQVLRTGKAPAGSVSGEEMMRRINERLGR